MGFSQDTIDPTNMRHMTYVKGRFKHQLSLAISADGLGTSCYSSIYSIYFLLNLLSAKLWNVSFNFSPYKATKSCAASVDLSANIAADPVKVNGVLGCCKPSN